MKESWAEVILILKCLFFYIWQDANFQNIIYLRLTIDRSVSKSCQLITAPVFHGFISPQVHAVTPSAPSSPFTLFFSQLPHHWFSSLRLLAFLDFFSTCSYSPFCSIYSFIFMMSSSSSWMCLDNFLCPTCSMSGSYWHELQIQIITTKAVWNFSSYSVSRDIPWKCYANKHY